MATQTSLFPFTGKLGNVIGYYRNGKYFLRSMPERVRQRTASRRAAYRFGIASKKGALIRHAVYSELDIPCDSAHVNRLNKTLIAAAGNDLAIIKGFRFNQQTGTDRFFTITPVLSDDGMLHIPAQTLPVNKGISMLEVKIIAARIHFATNKVIDTNVTTMMIDPGENFNGIALPVNVRGKGTLVVAMQIRGLHQNTPSFNGKYYAADIIGVLGPQTQQITHTVSRPRQQHSVWQPAMHEDKLRGHANTQFMQRE